MSYGTDAPQGLQPRFYLNGANWNGALSEYKINGGSSATPPAPYNVSLFSGDPVYVGTSTTTSAGSNGYLRVAVAGVSNPLLGVFFGCKYTNLAGQVIYSPYWSASTYTLAGSDVIAFVIDDPYVIFDIQSDNGTTGLAQSDMFNNGNLLAGTGSTITGQSAWQINATLDTTATAQVKLLRFTPVPTNIPYDGTTNSPWNNACVIINNHLLKGGTGTAGVHS